MDGTIIPASDINQFKTAMNGDLIPRNTSGIAAASAGDIGSSTYPFDNLHLSGGITSGDGQFVPPGGVLQTIFPTAVNGWLLANGDTIGDVGSGATHESAVYENLFNLCLSYFGNAGTELWINGDAVLLPDLRGYFIRPWDNSRGVDSGRAINTTQSSANLSHNHQTHNSTGTGSGGPAVHYHGQTFGTNPTAALYTDLGYSSTDFGGFPGISNTGGTEARPVNIALNYLIKY